MATDIETLRERVRALGHELLTYPGMTEPRNDRTYTGLYIADLRAGEVKIVSAGSAEWDRAEIEGWIARREAKVFADADGNGARARLLNTDSRRSDPVDREAKADAQILAYEARGLLELVLDANRLGGNEFAAVRCAIDKLAAAAELLDSASPVTDHADEEELAGLREMARVHVPKTELEMSCLKRLEAISGQRYQLFTRLHSEMSRNTRYALFSGEELADQDIGPAGLERMTKRAENLERDADEAD